MKRIMILLGMTFTLSMVSFAAGASDDPCKALAGGGGGNGGGGGGMPSVLCSGDGPKLELASGEAYWLIGKFKAEANGVNYFEVDLDVQPWLATKYRTSVPYYAVDLGEFTAPKPGQRVKVAVRAQIRVAPKKNTKTYGYDIVLKLLADPTNVAEKNRPLPHGFDQ